MIATHLTNIADMLLLNGTLLESPGLWYGRMGVAVFFFHYAQYSGNGMFEDYAVEIIEQIQAEIHRNSPADYANGLTGIGAGIEYLAQNGFLDINPDEILEDFDNRIHSDIFYVPQENNSLMSLGQYLLCRIAHPSSSSDKNRLLSNREMIIRIVNILENSEFSEDKYLTDVLSFLSRLHRLNVYNPQIEQIAERLKPHFRPELIFTESNPEKLLAYIPLIQLYDDIEEAVIQSVKNAIQKISESGTLSGENASDTLIWLLRCKRLTGQTGICQELASVSDKLIENPIGQFQEIRFEKGKLSLKGCAGTGLALMTTAGKCKDNWLDLWG
ncbi:MAG: hypothetical protein LBE91_11255 [Tannerella sp.]|jgi:hypothetical protein|nr:hypothetical protein [Tannerella sp.]